VRIIAGSLKRRNLTIPKGLDVRPTTDRTREAVFNWVVNRIEMDGASVLDLFAGSGALAFESISRGADEALLVEKSQRVAEVIRHNAEHLGIADQVRVASSDALTWLGRAPSAQFDLVFADPPYDYPDFARLPDAVLPLLTPDGVFVLEHGKPGQFEDHECLVDQRRYGRANIAFFRPKVDNGESPEDT
jgi:16S rRNA (guanine(966)-N(2))-methyltransferase RsmD